MVIPAEILSRYALIQPYLEPLLKIVHETLSAYCERQGFALVHRLKTMESLCEKIESGRYPNWEEIDDLVAFAIVIPTLLEEDGAISFLQEKFRPIRLRKRGSTMKSPEVFRFDSTRFVGRLRRPPGELIDRPVDIISFEIQVRSAFDHAWIVTTHALTYKAHQIDWKQQRLAAELKATTEKMDMLILAFEEASTKVAESPWPKIQAKKDIHAFFLHAAAKKRFPGELVPKDWSRFTDNIYELAEKCSARRKPHEIAGALIRAIDAELSALGPDKVPLSLSLWQITLASLSKANTIRVPTEDYWPLITPHLEQLYPLLREFKPRFDLGQ
jgi:ppGpp synthetase/RelA/SpoT-type nucleotidyltranferase